MAVGEGQPDRVVPDRIDGGDRHVDLAADFRLALLGAGPCTSAEGAENPEILGGKPEGAAVVNAT